MQPVTERLSQGLGAVVGSLSDTKLPFVPIRAGVCERIPADAGSVTWDSLPTAQQG